MEELFRGAGQLQLLRTAAEGFPRIQNFLFGGLVLKPAEHRCKVTVRHRHPQALRRKSGRGSVHDLVAFDMTPDLQRLLLGFFLFAADIGDHIVHHFRPALKGFARAGDRLIGADQRFFQTEFAQREQRRHIALQRAVGFHRHKTAFGAQPFALRGDDLRVLRVQLRNNHRHIRRAAMRAVVGNHGALGFGIRLFQRADLVFFHIHRAEHEVHFGSDLVHFGRVQHNHICQLLGQGSLHCPATLDRLFISFAGRTRAGSQRRHMEPRVVRQQGGKALSNHAGGADDAYIKRFHLSIRPFQ